jgi:hypothetical protein
MNNAGGTPVTADSESTVQPFPAQTVFKHEKAGGVAARPRQALDETGADRVNDKHEHDRHGAGRL